MIRLALALETRDGYFLSKRPEVHENDSSALMKPAQLEQHLNPTLLVIVTMSNPRLFCLYN